MCEEEEDMKICRAINNRLSEYYKLNNNNTYFKSDKRGLFLAYVDDNGYDDDDLAQELITSDTTNCMLINFDDDFPMNGLYEHDIEIHTILKQIFNNYYLIF
eukprot:339056_1